MLALWLLFSALRLVARRSTLVRRIQPSRLASLWWYASRLPCGLDRCRPFTMRLCVQIAACLAFAAYILYLELCNVRAARKRRKARKQAEAGSNPLLPSQVMHSLRADNDIREGYFRPKHIETRRNGVELAAQGSACVPLPPTHTVLTTNFSRQASSSTSMSRIRRVAMCCCASVSLFLPTRRTAARVLTKQSRFGAAARRVKVEACCDSLSRTRN